MIRDVVLLGVEDALSETVGKAVLASVRMSASQTFGFKGNTYLRKKISDLNKTAKVLPVFLITDLDSPTGCAPELIRDWLSDPPEPGLIFRVAVVEIESWIMAHRKALARFLAVSQDRVPRNPDQLRNAKEKLLTIASVSRRRDVRDDLLPARGSTAKVAPPITRDWASLFARNGTRGALQRHRRVSNVPCRPWKRSAMDESERAKAGQVHFCTFEKRTFPAFRFVVVPFSSGYTSS